MALWVSAVCEAQELGDLDAFDGIGCSIAKQTAASCAFDLEKLFVADTVVPCGQGTPARATICSRDGVDLCGALSPGDPEGGTLPGHRDSTAFNSTTIPGRGSGHELFHDVLPICPTVGECRLVTAYNAGFQVRQLDQPSPWQPGPPFRSADGWAGDFAEFAEVGENDFYVDNADAVFEPDGQMVLSVSGRQSVGPSLWTLTPQPNEILSQRYQDPTRRSRAVALYRDGDGLWMIAIGLAGIHVYDASAAVAHPSVCVAPGCGVYVGEVGAIAGGLHGAVSPFGGEAAIAVATSFSLEVWRHRPATASSAQVLGGPSSPKARAATVWSSGGRLYVAAVEWFSVSRWLRVYDLTPCWAAGCSAPPPPVFEVDLTGSPPSVLDLVTYSTAEDSALVCAGLETLNLAGPGRDRCFEVSGLPSVVAEIGLEGGAYPGACSGSDLVDYWSDLYPGNLHGLANFRPRVKRLGAVAGQLVLYQASYGVLHAHRVTVAPPPPAAIFSDGFESGDLSRWSP